MFDYRLLKVVEFDLHKYNERVNANWHIGMITKVR